MKHPKKSPQRKRQTRDILSQHTPLREAAFHLAAVEASGLPEMQGLEVAFAGRSNSGKSSALNAITDNRHLARVSRTPGRTRQINFFRLPQKSTLVDLPGYGYAAVNKAERRSWQSLVGAYFDNRESLRGVVLLMDCRHPLQDLDVQLLNWVTQSGRPVLILLSKTDKLSRQEAKNTLKKVENHLAQHCKNAKALLFSSLKTQGVHEARMVVCQWLGVGEQGK